MTDVRDKTAQAAPFMPAPDHPGMAPGAASTNDASQVIWQDPTSYNPYLHGPPYLPPVSEGKTASRAEWLMKLGGDPNNVELAVVLTLLRALAIIHQTHHWMTFGPSAYGDHQLFDRLYNDLLPEIDAVAERAVGIGTASDAMHPYAQMNQVTQIIETICGDGENVGSGTGPEALVQTSLRAEVWLLESMNKLRSMTEVSQGTENLLAGICDKHEQHIYLLRQRAQTVTASSVSWKADGS